MERIQLILLILLSSAYFLTCGKPGEKNSSAAGQAKQQDSLPGNNPGQAEDIFSSSWLTLPFSGSGTNWLATIDAPSLVQDILMSHEVEVFVKKSGTVYSLSDGDVDQNMDVIPEPGKIIISSDVCPDNVQFRYIISPGGTAGSQKNEGLNSLTALRKK